MFLFNGRSHTHTYVTYTHTPSLFFLIISFFCFFPCSGSRFRSPASVIDDQAAGRGRSILLQVAKGNNNPPHLTATNHWTTQPRHLVICYRSWCLGSLPLMPSWFSSFLSSVRTVCSHACCILHAFLKGHTTAPHATSTRNSPKKPICQHVAPCDPNASNKKKVAACYVWRRPHRPHLPDSVTSHLVATQMKTAGQSRFC